jgi:hypothetical protein
MKILTIYVIMGLILLSFPVQAQSTLDLDFVSPPDQTKPQVWWHWCNGNVTMEGITADLESMKRVNINGATIISVKYGPAGPVRDMSPEFFNMINWAAKEANRLGLELGIANCSGFSSSGGPWVTEENAMKKIVTSTVMVTGPTNFNNILTQPPTNLNYYKDIAVLAYQTPTGNLTIKNLNAKAGYVSGAVTPDYNLPYNSSEVITLTGVKNITANMDRYGGLIWNVPNGNWTILRIGYTLTGAENNPAMKEGTGLECDKFSKAAVDAFWSGWMGKVIAKIGPMTGTILKYVLIDSYEVGMQNWTSNMPHEFLDRCGYDMTPFMPVFTGRYVGSPEVTERFLWDFRRVIADLYAENYVGHMTELCHQNGLKLQIEPYGNFEFDEIQTGGYADIPMWEFWTFGMENDCKLGGTIGHVYGHKIIAAESFTSLPFYGRWQQDPYSLKSLADKAFCDGINMLCFHGYVHQPWLNRFPGMTMWAWGSRFGRNDTWWEQSSDWDQYLARSQYLLRQGLFNADFLFYWGEDIPTRGSPNNVPKGYDFDYCDTRALLTRVSVSNGKIVLPDGMSYRTLVLGQNKTMTSTTLKKIRQLIYNGATVIGPKPDFSPSLKNYPECDHDMITIVNEIWGDCDSVTIKEHIFGRGKVIWGKPLAEIFTDMGVKPDFEITNTNTPLVYIHRKVDSTDIYFVSNQEARYSETECIFRVNDKVPELWHPDNGKIEQVAAYENQSDGRTCMKLKLDPVGSMFVIFRKPSTADHVISSKWTSSSTAIPSSLVINKADFRAVDGINGSVDVTSKVKSMVTDGYLAVLVNNTTLGGNLSTDYKKKLVVDYVLDGVPATKTCSENKSLTIGTLTEKMTSDLKVNKDGHLELLAWKSGTMRVTTSANVTIKTNVKVDNPVEITGEWNLSFPPNWGAPSNVVLDKLISWTDYPDSGVRYFSGTATYTKEIVIDRAKITPDKSFYLDLGKVMNIAQVKVNGYNLGVLWKVPFRVEITNAIHAGRNLVEIKITNLWPNRLIGDQQLAEDCQWGPFEEGWNPPNEPVGQPLIEWPQWLLNNQPSPTGRYTFTTFKQWFRDSELLESGLIGPVFLRVAVKKIVGNRD